MQTTDKPLVRIDGADEAPAKPGTDGRRTLCDSDLMLVRAQLRAAAQSSNMHADFFAEAQEELLAATAKDSATGVLGMPGDADSLFGDDIVGIASDKGAVSGAAMETLLWFGLALGEPPRSHRQLELLQQHERQQQERQKLQERQRQQREALGVDAQLQPATMVAELQEAFGGAVEFDWVSETTDASLPPPPQKAPPSQTQTTPPAERPRASRVSSIDSTVSAATVAAETDFASFESGSERGDYPSARSERGSRPGSSCGGDNGSCSEAGAGRCVSPPPSESVLVEPASPSSGSSSRPVSECGGIEPVELRDREMNAETETAVRYCSPGHGVSGDRRSSREPRPPAQWKEEEAPLLKWEREQRAKGQQKGGKGQKRQRQGGGGDGTYETDSEDQLASQLGLNATSLLNTDALMLPDFCAQMPPAKLGRVM